MLTILTCRCRTPLMTREKEQTIPAICWIATLREVILTCPCCHVVTTLTWDNLHALIHSKPTETSDDFASTDRYDDQLSLTL